MDERCKIHWRELYDEVQNKYANGNSLKRTLSHFKHIKYYYPKQRFQSNQHSEMDYNNKVIYADSLVIVSLRSIRGRA
jgi:nicotinamide mononucleotide adenylyltransferase